MNFNRHCRMACRKARLGRNSARAEVSNFMIRAGGSHIWNLTNSRETVAKIDIRGAEYETFIVEKRVVAADTLEVIAQPTFGPS